MTNNQDYIYETQYLNKVYNLILREISTREDNSEVNQSQIVTMRKSFWDSIVNSNEEIENVIEIAHRINQLDQEQYNLEKKLDTIKKLRKLEYTPYFGKVVFKENEEDIEEELYIGLSSFIDPALNKIYIYDWRSPISALFYEYEKGPAEYHSPGGIISGEVSQKRQFRIFRNNIEYMFDSEVKIDDEVLQEILSKNTDDKMKNIVTTIQKEQNKIIRNNNASLLIVQGAAGSGKTSIALHRVAHILYSFKDKNLTSENIVIFSPNQMFNDYISNVLPELGEENINQTTFFEYSQKFIPSEYKLEDFNQQLEYLLSPSNSTEYRERKLSISYKASSDFLILLQNYIKYIETHLIKFEDIYYDSILIITKQELCELFYRDYIVTPVSKRLLKIRERIYKYLNPYKEQRIQELTNKLKLDPNCVDPPRVVARLTVLQASKPLMDKIEKMTSVNIFELYKTLFEDINIYNKVSENTTIPMDINTICSFTVNALNTNTLFYEDIPGYLYILGELEGRPNLSKIRHVVIDEAQDYSPIQYKIFKQLFPNSSMTILGDLNQSIHPYAKTEDYDTILNIFNRKDASIHKLTKSYRSIREIVQFSRLILKSRERVDYINRVGQKPTLFKITASEAIETVIVEDMEALLNEGYKSIAVICKTESESQKVHKALHRELKERKLELNIKLIDKDSEVFSTGLVVIPSFLSKGLEFDAVLIYNADQTSYYLEEERKLFYTICTRALHRLHLYYRERLTPLIPNEAFEFCNKTTI